MNKALMVALAVVGGFGFGYGVEKSLAQDFERETPVIKSAKIEAVTVAPIRFVTNSGSGQTGNYSCGG